MADLILILLYAVMGLVAVTLALTAFAGSTYAPPRVREQTYRLIDATGVAVWTVVLGGLLLGGAWALVDAL